MPDELNNEAGQGQSSAETQNTAHENRIPQSRFNEVIEERNTLKAELDKLRSDFESAKRKELEEKEDFRRLYEETQKQLDELKPRAGQYDDMLTSLRETVAARVERLPEDVRDLVPDYDDPRLTLQWLNANEAKLMRPLAPQMDAGARGDATKPGAKLTDYDRQLAKLMGVAPDELAAFKERRSKQDNSWEANLGFRHNIGDVTDGR